MIPAPILVYPTSLAAQPSDPEPDKLADVGHYFRAGQRVSWRYTVDEREEDCAYCQDGLCEQRVESCAEWKADMIIHDRPRWAQ